MMTTVIFEIKDSIARVILNRPQVHNAFQPEMIKELTTIFKSIQKNKAIRAVVLSGSGKSFCAGADLDWMQSMANYTYTQNVKDAEKLFEMFLAMRECDVPIVGRVHGSAFGGALGLMSVCDIVFAESKSIFCFSEVRLGLAPAVISVFVKEKMHASHIQRYFLTGAVFSASEAETSGLIHKVVESEVQLLNAVEEYLLKEVLVAGPLAARETKKLLRQLSGVQLTTKVKSLTTKCIAKLRVSDEGQEGLKSFFAKKKPHWRLM